MSDFVMPTLGADMEAGTLVAWRKSPGDPVKRGEIIAEVETEKGLIEVECFEAGVVDALLVAPGTKVPVGTPLARIVSSPVPVPVPVPVPASSPEPVPVPVPAPSPDRVRASPHARKLARELGVDLATLHPAVPGDAIHAAEILRGSAGPPAPRTPSAATSAPAATPTPSMRTAIAAAMSRSKREIPHYYVSHTIDMGPATSFLARANEGRSVHERLVPAVLLLRATARALAEHRSLNGHFADGAHRPSDRVHLGVAISLRGGGLIAPAIHDADTLEIDALMDAFRDLVTRARTGKLRASELSDATCTVTSLGERGVEAVLPVIQPPQVAMVGFGAIVTRPWVVGDAVVPRPVVTCTLAADHRVSDGHDGGRFVADLASALEATEEP